VPQASRDAFVHFIEAGFPDPHYGLRYSGGADSGATSFWALSGLDASTINVQVENKKPSSEFVVWLQTCNTERDWRPYWDNVLRSVRSFPKAKVVQKPFKGTE